MLKPKTVAIALSLLVSATSLAMAASPANNAKYSGGPGTHVGSMVTGSVSNSAKVEGNQNGYAPGRE